MTWKVCIRLIAGVGGPVKRDIIQPNARWPGYLVLHGVLITLPL